MTYERFTQHASSHPEALFAKMKMIYIALAATTQQVTQLCNIARNMSDKMKMLRTRTACGLDPVDQLDQFDESEISRLREQLNVVTIQYSDLSAELDERDATVEEGNAQLAEKHQQLSDMIHNTAVIKERTPVIERERDQAKHEADLVSREKDLLQQDKMLLQREKEHAMEAPRIAQAEALATRNEIQRVRETTQAEVLAARNETRGIRESTPMPTRQPGLKQVHTL